ncbi:hypothetical protein WDC_1122 [Paucilactobacillus wasatchensis]|uniref:PTS EIIA type-2 domain-containing protein n=2 Tax=Paucilactobacillus wasatchensis TaxID=1335616 RepID=A0A0D0YVK1_9LACO|nr:hypothetical protein WDC_1122 [Paucilactobacillus wasatchensis]
MRTKKRVTSSSHLTEDFLSREKMGNTIIDAGVALPHVKASYITSNTAIIFRLDHPIIWHSGEQITIVIALMVGEVDLFSDRFIAKLADESVLARIKDVALAAGEIREFLEKEEIR